MSLTASLMASRAVWISLITFTALYALLAVIWFWLIRRMIVRPLNEASRMADAIAEGDLTVRIHSDRQDEIGQLMGVLATKAARDLALDLKVKDFMGSTASVIQIQGAEFKFDKDYSPQLTITITGEKKSGSSDSGYDMISYKLYDSAGYLVDSGNIYLSSLSAGDKFKDDSVVIYDITPGESYTFQLSEYSW